MKPNFNKCMLGVLELTWLRYPLNKFGESLEFGLKETKPTNPPKTMRKVPGHLGLFQLFYELTENYAPPTTPLEAAKKETSADYKPAYPLRTSDQPGETTNQLSHGGVIVLPPTSSRPRKINDPFKRLAKCRETRTHYLCHFTLSFGRNYRCQNGPGPPDIPFDPSPFGSSKAHPVEWEEGNSVDPTTNIDKPYASQRHFAEIFRRYDLSKPWADQRRFTGFRGRNYRGQNCPGPPGTLTDKYAPLATPLEAAREATSADYRPTYTLRKPDQRWELVNQLSHRRVMVLSPTSNRRKKINDPLND